MTNGTARGISDESSRDGTSRGISPKELLEEFVIKLLRKSPEKLLEKLWGELLKGFALELSEEFPIDLLEKSPKKTLLSSEICGYTSERIPSGTPR